MQTVRGIAIALAIFAAAFALHIVGGATDQRWLFVTAVALIFISATAFPLIALIASGRTHASRNEHLPAFVIGIALTQGALWAAADRSFLAWHPLVATLLVAAVSVPFIAFLAKWFRPTPPRSTRQAAARR